MTLGDLFQLAAIYGGYASLVFCVSYAAISLFGFFKSIGDPGWRSDD